MPCCDWMMGGGRRVFKLQPSSELCWWWLDSFRGLIFIPILMQEVGASVYLYLICVELREVEFLSFVSLITLYD